MKTIKITKILIFLFCQLFCINKYQAAPPDSTNYLHYYRIINEAKYYLYHMDYSESKKYYKQAFDLGLSPSNRDQYDYAKVLSEMGDTIPAIEILSRINRSEMILDDSTYFTDISIMTREKLVEQAENRQQILRENYESNEEEKRVQKLAENIFNYRNYRGDTISAGNDVRKQRIIDSIHAIADKNYQLIGEFIVEKGFAPFRMGLEYSNNSDLRYFLFQVDSTWYIKNKDFIKNEIAKGNLSPNALYMYNRHLTIQLKDSLTTPEMYFNLLNEWGISPYFEWENFTLPRKGFASARMRYYDLYEQEKYRFNCIDFNK